MVYKLSVLVQALVQPYKDLLTYCGITYSELHIENRYRLGSLNASLG